MSRRSDLEDSIRESYGIIREYEATIRTSNRPEEKLRARRVINQQRELIGEYLDELLPLAQGALPADMAEIAARFSPGQAAPPRPVPEPASEAAPNPFGDLGRITDPARFFDRKELLRQVFEELGKGVNLSLVGEAQSGKSSLLSMICALGPQRLDPPPDRCAYLSLEWVADEDEFYDALCDALGIDPPCRGYPLTRALRGRRCLLCLDEMEKMTWQGFTKRVRSQLRGLADGPGAPLKLVIASRSPLAHLFPDSPELDSPLAGVCRPLDVGPFTAAVARAFLAGRLQGTGVAFGEDEVARLVDESGGHPARLQRAARDLYHRIARDRPVPLIPSALSAAPPAAPVDLQDLRRRLIERCDLDDLKDLCFALEIDHDDYPDTKNGLVRELLLDLRRQGRVAEFVTTVRREKPWVLE